MSQQSSRLNIWAGLIGNVLERYDCAVFSLLAPLIAPLFFPTLDPLTAIITTYCMLPLGILARPFGSLLFGYIGDNFGRKRALYLSMGGMACTTGLMGCLPLYETAGIGAPLLLAAGRFFQQFFASGECAGGAVFILEHTPAKERSFVSSIYGSSTVLGVLLASCLVTGVYLTENPVDWWRLPFWLGFGTSIAGFILRRFAQETPEFKPKKKSLAQVLSTHRSAFLTIIAVSGFFHASYSFAFVVMNSLLPNVSSLSHAQVMGINTGLLFADMLLLPLFGKFSGGEKSHRYMFFAALFAVVTSYPLFALCEGATFIDAIFIRTVIAIIGIAFSAPFHSWIQQLIPQEHRYTLISLGYAIGTQLIGTPAPIISLWLYRRTGLVGAPAIYYAAAALTAAVAIYRHQKSLTSVRDLYTEIHAT